MNRGTSLSAVVWTAILLAGCASHQVVQPMQLPAAQARITYFIGTPLSGSQQGDASKISLGDALDVRASWFALDQMEARSMALVGTQARIITATRAGLAVLPSAGLTSSARIEWADHDSGKSMLDAANRGRKAALSDLRLALPRGVTASLQLVDSGGVGGESPGNSRHRRVEINIGRPSVAAAAGQAEKLQIGIVVEDFYPQISAKTDAALAPAERMVFERETAVMDHAIDGYPATLLMILPFRFSSGSTHAVAAIVTISHAKADAAFQDAIAQCKKDLQGINGNGQTSATWSAGLDVVMDSLADPERRRAAMVYLADRSDARICQDVALVADDALLASIAGEIERQGRGPLDGGDLPGFSWTLDRCTIDALRPLLAKAQLPDELFAVLTLHFGEPGRHAAAVDELMHGATSRQDLDRRLVEENFIYLQDPSPSQRVRALDWLTARGLAPAGYDPMASAKQRRLALDRALSAAATTAPAAGGAP